MSDRELAGIAAFLFALASVFSPFVTSGALDLSPGWVFLVGAGLAVVAIWQGIRAATAVRGTPGRGMGITGIVLGVLGLAWTSLVAFVEWMVESDQML